jgi:hypothetical protein
MSEGTYEVELLIFHTKKFQSIIAIIMKNFVEYRKQRVEI